MTPVSSSSLALQLFRGFAPTDNSAATDAAARIQEIVQKTVSGEISPAMKQVATLASTLAEQKQAVMKGHEVSTTKDKEPVESERWKEIKALTGAARQRMADPSLSEQDRAAIWKEFQREMRVREYSREINVNERPKYFSTNLTLSGINGAKYKYHDNISEEISRSEDYVSYLTKRLETLTDPQAIKNAELGLLQAEYNLKVTKQMGIHFDALVADWTARLRATYDVTGTPLIKLDDGSYEWGNFEVRFKHSGEFHFGKAAHEGGKLYDPSLGRNLNIKLSR